MTLVNFLATSAVLALTGHGLTVTDGDTVRLGDERIRIQGIDAPETRKGQYRCEGERRAGVTAAAILQNILDTAERVQVVRTGTAAWNRTEARILVDGVRVGDLLVAAGAARYAENRRPWWVCNGG